jgi:hypothetical protein
MMTNRLIETLIDGGSDPAQARGRGLSRCSCLLEHGAATRVAA